MELLQKLTLYDLIGYTIPGMIFLWLCSGNGLLPELVKLEDRGAIYWCVMVIIGYITGIVIAEIIEIFVKLVEKLCGKLCEKFKGDRSYYWDYLSKVYGISEAELKSALGELKETDDGQCNGVGGILKKYSSYIYSDVQTDEKYSRLHNYASAELLYRNMTVVFIAALVMELCKGVHPEIIVYIIGMVCFAFRFIKFRERKMGYAACWFIQKHLYDK